MPLKWKKGENPYRNNYFAILEVGPNTPPPVMSHKRADLVRRIRGHESHVVAGRAVTEAEINEAEARLQDPLGWLVEALLVHPVPAGEIKRLQQLCRAIIEQTTPPPTPSRLRLDNLHALIPLVAAIEPDDVAWPDWEEFSIVRPRTPQDRAWDVQFDM